MCKRELLIAWGLVQLVPAVTELIVAELLYLQYKDRQKPIYLYINSTGTTRADGETVSIACNHFQLFQHSSYSRACMFVS